MLKKRIQKKLAEKVAGAKPKLMGIACSDNNSYESVIKTIREINKMRIKKRSYIYSISVKPVYQNNNGN